VRPISRCCCPRSSTALDFLSLAARPVGEIEEPMQAPCVQEGRRLLALVEPKSSPGEEIHENLSRLSQAPTYQALRMNMD
jgi:hypothetical protein